MSSSAALEVFSGALAQDTSTGIATIQVEYLEMYHLTVYSIVYRDCYQFSLLLQLQLCKNWFTISGY